MCTASKNARQKRNIPKTTPIAKVSTTPTPATSGIPGDGVSTTTTTTKRTVSSENATKVSGNESLEKKRSAETATTAKKMSGELPKKVSAETARKVSAETARKVSAETAVAPIKDSQKHPEAKPLDDTPSLKAPHVQSAKRKIEGPLPKRHDPQYITLKDVELDWDKESDQFSAYMKEVEKNEAIKKSKEDVTQNCTAQTVAHGH